MLRERGFVSKRAAAHHTSFELAERELWSEIAQATHTKVIDPAFRMPDLKGILVNP
jgi:hypothetical protein